MSTSESPKIYGWFSWSASLNQKNKVIYETMKGDKIPVSSVTTNPNDSGLVWKDTKFVGELKRFISSTPNPNYK